jgi:nitroreductase
MVRARHSVRNFEATPVEGDLIRNAVDLALRAPSVCNRQAWRVYALTSSDAIARALTAQNGNSGFGHQLQMLLVVACDLTRFLTIGERNQGWIDGGMFSMMLVLALHSHGLGTCCLNLSLDCQQDMRLREVVPIADHESPVMMIAVGHMPESLSVAQSRRRPVADVLTWVGETA